MEFSKHLIHGFNFIHFVNSGLSIFSFIQATLVSTRFLRWNSLMGCKKSSGFEVNSFSAGRISSFRIVIILSYFALELNFFLTFLGFCNLCSIFYCISSCFKFVGEGLVLETNEVFICKFGFEQKDWVRFDFR